MGGSVGARGLRPSASRPRRNPAEHSRSRVSASALRGFGLLRNGVFPSARLDRLTSQTLQSGSDTIISLDTSTHDTPKLEDPSASVTWQMADAANNELVIVHAGFYLCVAQVDWDANADGTYRSLRIVRATSGGSIIEIYENRAAPSDINQASQALGMAYMEVGETLQLVCKHDRGSALNITPSATRPVYLAASWQSL